MIQAIKIGKGYTFECTNSEAWLADDSSTGLCLFCGEIEEGRCEPDARGYECSYCGHSSLYGFAELVLMGKVSIV